MQHAGTLSDELLNAFQRGFPVVPRPFAVVAEKLGTSEADVLNTLRGLQDEGLITRVGGCIRPNTMGTSTLAAMAVPAHRLPAVTDYLSGLPAVNHSYLREDDWNLWFVVATPDENTLSATLSDIALHTGLRVLDLRLQRPFHIDLGFNLKSGGDKQVSVNRADTAILMESDRPLLQALSEGLPLVSQPYAAIARDIGVNEQVVLDRIKALCDAGIITRLGVIVRHRDLGWASNAMVVWRISPENIVAAGERLAALPGITLCYQRRTEDVWPFALYTMVHAKSRSEALAVISKAAALQELRDVDHKVLFSTHCYKQTGAWLLRKEAA